MFNVAFCNSNQRRRIVDADPNVGAGDGFGVFNWAAGCVVASEGADSVLGVSEDGLVLAPAGPSEFWARSAISMFAVTGVCPYATAGAHIPVGPTANQMNQN